VKRLGFRARLFLILFLFAVLPSVVLTLVWATTVSRGLPLVGASAAWDSVAATGGRAIEEARRAPLSREAAEALRAHEGELRTSLEQARRFRYLAERAVPVTVVLALIVILGLVLVASRVAGHLSRQLSRPLAQLVEWTERIARGRPLPAEPARKGAPEFEVLRERMRQMAHDLERGRTQALEAERAEALRETARQVAHELKNPLTPIRFAVERLRREAGPEVAEWVEVLAVESERLEQMARSFAQFGRLPEGPRAEVDVAELVRYAARSTVPAHVRLILDIEPDLPMVRGHHDALARALSNVLINAVEACGERPESAITVRAHRVRREDREAVEVAVRDTGCGIPPEQLPRIWEPYVTQKRGGTGLGLAIVRQTILAHDGAVDALSRVGEGTEIRFTLPVERSPAAREAGQIAS
jgi:signal transduction histidine kinase